MNSYRPYIDVHKVSVGLHICIHSYIGIYIYVYIYVLSAFLGYTWVCVCFTVEANESGIIKIAPPILSRVYNELGNGIVNLQNARKITEFPIPFPLAQMITVMLMFHWVITAIVCAASLDQAFWVGLLSFVAAPLAFSFYCSSF